MSATTRSRESIISEYFSQGYNYSLILCFLESIHGISLSLRQLKRILRRMNLRRRPPPLTGTRRLHLKTLIQHVLGGSASLLGYRALWHKLRVDHNIIATRDSIMVLLAEIDPESSRQRRQHRLKRRQYNNKGPNYVWHCDGMDKLKRFGIAVHGGIDGYSRRVLWLKAGISNNNPTIIAYYFLEYVNTIKGVPRLLRTDCGTENTNIAFIQPYLRRNHADCFSGSESFRYGKSVTNQRIEAWWSILKKRCTQWWYDFFLEMSNYGLFDETNQAHVDSLRVCFMHLVQKDFDSTRREWNCHRIRASRNSCTPSGHPDELYFLPHILGTQNYLCNISNRDLDLCHQYAEDPAPPASIEFLELAKEFMENNEYNNLSLPQTVPAALNLYVDLTAYIDENM